MKAKYGQILIAMAVLMLSALACGSGMSGPRVGAEAPDFGLPTVQGSELALSAFRGRPVVLNFFTTWCGPCRAEMPAMQEVYRRYAGDGLILLAVDLEDDPAEVISYGKELGLSFPLLLDEQGRIGAQYGVSSFPRTFFIDTEGVIRKIAIGSMQEEEIEAGIADLLERAQAVKPRNLARPAGKNITGVQGCINVGAALARSGPGKQHPGVLRLERAACFSFDARTADAAWVRLEVERGPAGERLWVMAEFISLEKDTGALPVAE